MQSTGSLIINFENEGLEQSITVTQFDTGKKVMCHIAGISGNIGAAMVYCKKPSGLETYTDADIIDDHTVEFSITEQMDAEIGDVKSQLQLFGEDKSLTSYRFKIRVRENLIADSRVTSADDYPAFRDAIEKFTGKIAGFSNELKEEKELREAEHASMKAQCEEAITAEKLERQAVDNTEKSERQAADAAEKSERMQEIAVERARINNLVANNNPTEGNSELIDIRVGANGETYESAGEATRNQAKRNEESITSLSAPNYYKNIADPDKLESGYIRWTDGNIGEHATYKCSDYTFVMKDACYATSFMPQHLAFYDLAKKFVQTIEDNTISDLEGTRVINVTKDSGTLYIFKSPLTGYVRLTVDSDDFPTTGTPCLYPIKSIFDTVANQLPTKNVKYTPEYIAPNAGVPVIAENKLDKIYGKNLYYSNPDNEIQNGYINYDGTILYHENYNVSDLILLTYPEKEYTISGVDTGGAYIGLFDANNDIIRTIPQSSDPISFTIEEGVKYLRVSISRSTEKNIQLELGDSATHYKPYTDFRPVQELEERVAILEEKVSGLGAVERPELGELTSLQPNNILEYSDFPYHLKKGLQMSFQGSFTTFSKLLLGKGYSSYRGSWLEIDNTNIKYIYDSSGSVKDTKEHGLTISDFIKVFFTVDNDSICNVTLITKGGSFSTTFDWAFEMNYEAFAMSETAMTDVRLNASSTEFQNHLWMFGDSYFGVNNTRVIGHLKDFGYIENVLINGLAGQTSPDALADLKRCLNYGTPKYLIWCLGMNGSDNDYATSVSELITLCETKNIELILTLIPSVPNRAKETINDFIKETGCQYIDWYKAVGAQTGGTWYDGYLSSDNVHPTEIGAAAIAAQCLVDAPQIMQYR